MSSEHTALGAVSVSVSLAAVESRTIDCAPHPRIPQCAGDPCDCHHPERGQKDDVPRCTGPSRTRRVRERPPHLPQERRTARGASLGIPWRGPRDAIRRHPTTAHHPMSGCADVVTPGAHYNSQPHIP